MESAITPKKGPGPLLGTIWWVLTVVIVAIVAYSIDSNVYRLLLGYRSAIALVGYLVMQIALWFAEFKWDEMGSAAYLEVNIVKLLIWLWFLVIDCHYLMPHFSNLEKNEAKKCWLISLLCITCCQTHRYIMMHQQTFKVLGSHLLYFCSISFNAMITRNLS